MSIKSCIRVVPLVKNVFNLQQLSCAYRPVLLQYNNTQKFAFSVSNIYNSKFFSTEPKRDIKQVYYGPLTPQIKAVKVFSLSSSIVGIIAQPFLYTEIAATGNVPIIVAAYSVIGFFTVVTPFLLHFITKKYVTYLDYKESNDSYIAKTVNFFCMTKKTEFTPNEVTVPDVPGMFTTFHAKGKALFLDPRYFDEPEHYAKIMGFDKPMDFKLYETADAENSAKKA